MSETPSNELISENNCLPHQQPAKWHCSVCGLPICSVCQPVAWNFEVFHPGCLAQAHGKEEKKVLAKKPVDAPTLGVQWSGYYLIVKAVVYLAAFLLFEGIAIFGKTTALREVLTSSTVVGLDAIPGGRIWIIWIGLICLGFAISWSLLGMGLLNCMRAARRLLLVFSAIDVISSALIWLAIVIAGQGMWLLPVSSTIFLWYFLKPSVRRQFLPS